MPMVFLPSLSIIPPPNISCLLTSHLYMSPLPLFILTPNTMFLPSLPPSRLETLPANLIQAQRDYFGAHTYELLSKPGTFVHTNWTGHGGNVSASTYSA